MFIWKAEVFLDELRRYQPELAKRLSAINSAQDLERAWPEIAPISVDYGVMEHSKRIALVPADFSWTDLGSWDALEEVLPKDKQKNIIHADNLNYQCEGVSVYSRSGRLICTLGLKDLIIADTPDALLVCHKEKAQDVKKIVDSLKKSGRKEHIVHITEKRPWGSYTVLKVGEGFKIKIVEIEPQKRLSLQRHAKRAEHWVVVGGVAKVTCGKTVKMVRSNESIYIPKLTKHRLENPGASPLKIVEVQTGDYLEEDDIERFEDDFIR
jgi:mannose-1-phosphate guanylyltransferase/mannose-6-phosphate isomerase